MKRPTILVTAAAGSTGNATARQLLEQGYPVRALVRRLDQRSEQLRKLGAELVVGSMNDMLDMRAALKGVQRAYYCPPIARDALAMAATFAAAAQEQRLEMVTVMSQWLADPTNPSKATRETWLADRLFAWMADVPTVTVNPGWFADNYRMAGLEVVAHLGLMLIPLGQGRNAPPSNEDIARVIVGTLTDPAPHLGTTYRPTGPRLLAPEEIAEAFGNVLGRRVRYVDVPPAFSTKILRADGSIPDFQIAQVLSYLEEYRRGSFAIGAPTSAVLEVGGREPEAFEVIARRYLAANRNTARTLGGFTRTMLAVLKTMVTPALDPAAYARRAELPQLQQARYSSESPEWVASHGAAAPAGGAAPVLAAPLA
jgi:NAD(P)H dehydrogenase (quinone)